jgi:Peptidase family S41
MSEKLFALLLRLYPSRFRQHYETEAIMLLRERFRDEQGTARRLRLFFDLLVDFAAGLPLAWRNSYASPAPQPASGLPLFRVLDQEPMRPGSVFVGALFAMAALSAFVFVMNHGSAYHPFSRFHGLAHRSAGQANPSVQDVADELDRQVRTASAVQSCGFEKLELHPGNIGYVKLNSFPNPDRCGQIAQAVMERLNSTDAVIFDLRDNRGGFPQMVRMMADYLFDRPVPWYNPRSSSPEPSLTHSPVPGSRLANKPVFILTSSRTFSAAEHFTYDLKTLKRATIIGETTSGASHGSGPPPEGTIPVWEGTGVQPDVKVNANDALRTAENLVRHETKK